MHVWNEWISGYTQGRNYKGELIWNGSENFAV